MTTKKPDGDEPGGPPKTSCAAAAAATAAAAVSSLYMYDFPELQSTTDRYYSHVQRMCLDQGLSEAPTIIDRSSDLNLVTEGTENRLFLGQTCGLPLVTTQKNALQLVAIPRYLCTGCDGSMYSSAILIHQDSDITTLDDLRGKVVAKNSSTSLSGSLLFDATLGKAGISKGELKETFTKAHEKSMLAVQEKRADVASVDCVSLALLRSIRSSALKGLKVLQYTEAAYSLPLVTSIHKDKIFVKKMKEALLAVHLTDAAEKELAALFIAGYDVETSLNDVDTRIKELKDMVVTEDK